MERYKLLRRARAGGLRLVVARRLQPPSVEAGAYKGQLKGGLSVKTPPKGFEQVSVTGAPLRPPTPAYMRIC
jgi:hypothetical protein